MPQQIRKRKRKKRRDNTPIVVAAITGAVVLFLAIFLIVKFSRKKTDDNVQPESELSMEVSVDGINITGLMESEAREKLNEKYRWTMKVSDESGKEYQLSNLISKSINSVLDDIYDSNTLTKSNYSIDFDVDEVLLDQDLKNISEQWNRPMHNASISGYDKSSGSITYSGEESGLLVDEEKLRNDIVAAVYAKSFGADIRAEMTIAEPEISIDNAKELYKTIGTFTTKSTANPDRNNNLNLACQAVNGLILQPEEEFSFNLTTGNRTVEKGYKAAGAYQNGELVEEPGGGVCQVASTLYNALVFSGLEITERHAHTFEPSYVTPGEDATVSYDGYSGPDLKFVNNTSSTVLVLAHYSDQTVTCSIVGIPVLPEGTTIKMHSVKDESYQPEIAAVVYEDDPTLPPHTEQEVQKGDQGSRWSTVITSIASDGTQTEIKKYSTTYKGHTPKIKRNLTDFQLDEEGNVVASSHADESDIVLIGPNGETITPIETSATQPETSQTQPSGSAQNSSQNQGGPGQTTAAQNQDGPGRSVIEYDDPDEFIPDEPDPIPIVGSFPGFD